MLSEEDGHAILRNLRLIVLDCFDLTAVKRLRLLADQIEQKIQTPSLLPTKLTTTEGPDATPKSTARDA
jgi:hypothetical protein